jgi:uncharacterized protein (TIGR02246 family)
VIAVTRMQADAWLERYGAAWRRADPQAASELFSDDCRYFETPYSAPATGRDGVRRYWQAVPDGQREVRFDHSVLAIVGDTVVAHWTASFVRASTGARVALDGVFVLEFADAEHCRVLREWWHRDERAAA